MTEDLYFNVVEGAGATKISRWRLHSQHQIIKRLRLSLLPISKVMFSVSQPLFEPVVLNLINIYMLLKAIFSEIFLYHTPHNCFFYLTEFYGVFLRRHVWNPNQMFNKHYLAYLCRCCFIFFMVFFQDLKIEKCNNSVIPVRALLCSYRCFNSEGHQFYGVAFP